MSKSRLEKTLMRAWPVAVGAACAMFGPGGLRVPSSRDIGISASESVLLLSRLPSAPARLSSIPPTVPILLSYAIRFHPIPVLAGWGPGHARVSLTPTGMTGIGRAMSVASATLPLWATATALAHHRHGRCSTRGNIRDMLPNRGGSWVFVGG